MTNKLVNVTGHQGPLFYEVEFLREVWRSLERKALMVHVGCDEFTAAEKFAYDVLKDITWTFKESEIEE